MKKTYNDQDELFIKDNYPSKGNAYCSETLRLKPKTVNKIASKLKIRILPELRRKIMIHNQSLRKPKENDRYNINIEQFLKVSTPQTAYILGLLWADGYIYLKAHVGQIYLGLIKQDFDEIKPILQSVGKWNIYYRKRSINRKVIGEALTTNKPLVKWLINMGYKVKSTQSACNIIKHIPIELQRYWFLGLVDGDGCFYLNTNQQLRQFSIASSYDQDWIFVENLCKNLDIKSLKIKRRTQGKHKSSVVRLTNHTDLTKLINFLYPVGFEFGLKRKYNKSQEILKSFIKPVMISK